MTSEATVDRFLAVWGEPDPVAARRRLEEVCHREIRYHNPVVVLTGTAALAQHIGELAPLIGTRRLSRTTELQQAGPWCRYGWALLPSVPGTNIAGQTATELEAGLVTCVVSFHGELPGRSFILNHGT